MAEQVGLFKHHDDDLSAISDFLLLLPAILFELCATLYAHRRSSCAPLLCPWPFKALYYPYKNIKHVCFSLREVSETDFFMALKCKEQPIRTMQIMEQPISYSCSLTLKGHTCHHILQAIIIIPRDAFQKANAKSDFSTAAESLYNPKTWAIIRNLREHSFQSICNCSLISPSHVPTVSLTSLYSDRSAPLFSARSEEQALIHTLALTYTHTHTHTHTHEENT